jgi:hypothetical protein
MKVEPIVAQGDAEEGVDPFHYGNEATPARPVLKVDVRARPAPRDTDREEPAVGREVDRRPVFGLAPFAEEQGIAPPVLPEWVFEDMTVVVLFSRGHAAGLGIAGVEETRAVGPPFQRAGPRPGDDIRQVPAGFHPPHPQRALLAAAFGDAVGHQPAVRARIVPVQSRGRVRAEGGGIEQDPVNPRGADPHVEHRLLLCALPPLIEVAAAPHGGGRNGADREESGQPRADLVSPG